MTGPDPIELAREWLDKCPSETDRTCFFARALLVRDRQLRELREAVEERVAFYGAVNANRETPSRMVADALADFSALAASDTDKTGPADPARLKDDHPRSGPPAAPQEKGASGGASTTRAASDPDSERGGA